jgi:hypothetical protein
VAITLVQSNSGGQNTATSTATASLTTPATAGNLLVAFVGSDAYATAGAPSGWTESTGCRQQTFLGSYVWWKVAAGGETGVTKALSPNGTYAWAIGEWSGTDPAPFDISAGQLAQSSAANYTTPSLTPTTGDRLLIAAMGGSHGTTTFTDLTTWVNSFTRIVVGISTIGGAHDIQGFGTITVTANGSTAYSSGATYAPSSPESRTGIILAFKASSSGTVGAVTATETAAATVTASRSDSGAVTATSAAGGTVTAARSDSRDVSASTAAVTTIIAGISSTAAVNTSTTASSTVTGLRTDNRTVTSTTTAAATVTAARTDSVTVTATTTASATVTASVAGVAAVSSATSPASTVTALRTDTATVSKTTTATTSITAARTDARTVTTTTTSLATVTASIAGGGDFVCQDFTTAVSVDTYDATTAVDTYSAALSIDAYSATAVICGR